MSYTPSKELRHLIDSSLGGSISKVEMATLETLLEDEQALEFYFDVVANEALIPKALGSGPAHIQKTSKITSQLGWLGLAASIAFIVGLILPSPLETQPQVTEVKISSDGNAATITNIVSAVWDNNTNPSLKISPDSPPILLKSGLMELTFASGVRTIIEGPASIQVDGNNEATMQSGRLVAEVPKGAEGFTVNYDAGKVVDLGTEFALYIPEDSKLAEVGVFKGEVEIYNTNDVSPIKITQNQAMIHGGAGEDAYRSVPFDHQAYIRDIPSHEFKWSLDSLNETLEFDVSHLVWRSGSHRAIMKWMNGDHSVIIQQMDLLFNDQVVSTDQHSGQTGIISRTRDNTYEFHIAEELRSKGKWTLRAIVKTDAEPNSKQPANSSGVLLFEDSLSIDASEEDFIGTWTYTFDGEEHQRTFYADHTASHVIGEKENSGYIGAKWTVTNGILSISFPPKARNSDEHHVLRNRGELIFVNRPYHNAKKLKN